MIFSLTSWSLWLLRDLVALLLYAICISLVAMIGLEKCCITSACLHITQVSEPWPVGLLLVFMILWRNIENYLKLYSKSPPKSHLTCIEVFCLCLFMTVLHIFIQGSSERMMMMMSSGLTTHQPMRVICVKMVN